MVALIDYGAGNLTSVRKALAHLGAAATTPAAPADLGAAAGVIVPGVGNFEVTAALDEGWRGALRRHVERGRPLLGICVGMQWLFDGSAEAPGCPGLALMPGTCRLITADGGEAGEPDDPEDRGVGTGPGAPDRRAAGRREETGTGSPGAPDRSGGGRRKQSDTGVGGGPGAFKVPHVGWNSLHRTRGSWLLEGVDEGDQVYFTHSYAAPLTETCVGSTRYGVEFAAAVEQDAVGGVQFHPEKSSDVGLRILSNFLRRVS